MQTLLSVCIIFCKQTKHTISGHQSIKKPSIHWAFFQVIKPYLFITYIVTSKPKRISVAAGVVHIIISLVVKHIHMMYPYELYYTEWF
jgi:hypothetical protein